MADKIPYGRGIDAVGLPTGELGGAAGEAFESGEAFDLPGVFDKVKDWLVNNDDKIIRVVAPWLRKQLRNVSGVEALELPDSMSITKLVLPSQVARLSPAVKKLTKGDLIALGGWGVPRKLPEVLGLTAKDIQTIRDVFTPQMTSIASFSEEPEAWDVGISCCSCTPCCCAAAVTRPVRPVA